MYRRRDKILEVFLVHPGGPFWSRKDLGAWTIPKGERQPGEDPLDAAKREFREETGFEPDGALTSLGEIVQSKAKTISAWAFEGDGDPDAVRSNTFLLEFPPRSGRDVEFPEVDRAGWFSIEEARQKLLPGQRPLLDRLLSFLDQRDELAS